MLVVENDHCRIIVAGQAQTPANLGNGELLTVKEQLIIQIAPGLEIFPGENKKSSMNSVNRLEVC